MNINKIHDALERQEEGGMMLFNSGPGDFDDINRMILKEAQHQDVPLIYVAFKRPYITLQQAYPDLLQDAFVIDCITKELSEKDEVQADNVTYLRSPQDLANISTAISLAVGKDPQKGIFVVVDALDSLLIHNTTKAVTKFLKDIKDKIRTLDINCIFLKVGKNLTPKFEGTSATIFNEIIYATEYSSNIVTIQQNEGESPHVPLPEHLLDAVNVTQQTTMEWIVKDRETLELHKT
jgi:hypothetical protein